MKQLPLLKIPNETGQTDIQTDKVVYVTQIGIPVLIVYYTSFYYPRHSVNRTSFHDPRLWVILHAFMTPASR